MRLSARLFAPLLAVVAFAVPATVPAAHAAQIPAPTAVFVDTLKTPAAPAVLAMKGGSQLQIVNAVINADSPTLGYTFTYTLSNGVSKVIAFGDTAAIQTDVPNLTAIPDGTTWTLTRSDGAHLATIIVL